MASGGRKYNARSALRPKPSRVPSSPKSHSFFCVFDLQRQWGGLFHPSTVGKERLPALFLMHQSQAGSFYQTVDRRVLALP